MYVAVPVCALQATPEHSDPLSNGLTREEKGARLTLRSFVSSQRTTFSLTCLDYKDVTIQLVAHILVRDTAHFPKFGRSLVFQLESILPGRYLHPGCVVEFLDDKGGILFGLVVACFERFSRSYACNIPLLAVLVGRWAGKVFKHNALKTVSDLILIGASSVISIHQQQFNMLKSLLKSESEPLGPLLIQLVSEHLRSIPKVRQRRRQGRVCWAR